MANRCVCHIGGREFKLNMITIEPVVLLYMFASHLNFPAIQALVYKKTCLENFNTSFCELMDNTTFQRFYSLEEDIIQSAASYWIMLTNICATLPAIFTIFVFIGSWGDKVDRKIPILLPCTGALISNLFNVLNCHFMEWPVRVLLIGSVVDGLFGGYVTLLMGLYSYMTHISQAEEKTTRVGIAESMTYLSGTISVFVSGLLLTAVGFTGVFAILSGCAGGGILYTIFFLKSVRPQVKEEKKENMCTFWFLDSLKEIVLCLKRSRPNRSKLRITLQILVLNIVQMCTTGEGDILFLYLKRSPRNFSSTLYGYFRGAEYGTRSLALLLILPVLKQVLKLRDTSVVLLGLVSKAICLIILGLATNTTLVFVVVAFAMFQGFPAAGLRSHMSSLVDKEEQGRLFAIVAATESAVTLATTFIFNGWYPETLSTFDGTCFEFAAGMIGLALLITLHLHITMKTDSTYEMQDKTQSASTQEKYINTVDVQDSRL